MKTRTDLYHMWTRDGIGGFVQRLPKLLDIEVCLFVS